MAVSKKKIAKKGKVASQKLAAKKPHTAVKKGKGAAPKKSTKTKKSSSPIAQLGFLSDPNWIQFHKNASNYLVIIDRDANILDVNKVAGGQTKEQIVGCSAYLLTHPDSRVVAKRTITSVFKDGKPRKYQAMGEGAGGSWAHYSVTVTPIVEKKKIVAAILDVVDVTELATFRQQLKKSEEKYHQLSDAAFEGIVIHQHGKVVRVNKAATIIFGYSEKEIVDMDIFHFIHPDYHQFAVDKLNRKDERVYEMVMLKKGKTPFWAELAAREIVFEGERARVVAIRDITANKEVAKALEESESRFRMLAENAVDIISRYQIQPELKLEYISPSIEHISGYSTGDFYKDPHFASKIIHPDDLEIVLKRQQEFVTQPEKTAPKPIVSRLIRKDGTVIWLETVNRTVVDKEGRLIAIESVARDITERKKLEKEIVEGDQALSQILDTINELVYYVEFKPNGDREIKYLGSHIYQMLGITVEEYKKMGKDLLNMVHPDDIEQLQNRALELKTKLVPQQFTYRFLNKRTNQYIWLEDRITPRLDENGKHIGNFGITSDVTERVKTQMQLQENEEKFRMLAENALDVIYRFSVDPTPQYEYVSPSIYRMTGYTPEDFYNDPYIAFKIMHPEDVHLIGNAEESLKRDNEINSIKSPEVVMRWIKKDGSIIWTETRNQNVYDRNGKKIAIEGISRDITLQKQSEEQLHESKERFRLLSNVAFEGIVFSENSIIIDANDQFLNMFGYTDLKEVVGKHLIEDFVVKEQQDTAKKYARLSSSVSLEVNTLRRDGSILPVEIKGQTIPVSNRMVRATVIYDITQRKEYERALQQSVENYKSLVDSSPDGVLIHKNGKVIFANPSAARIIGATSTDELLEFDAFHFILEEYREEAAERVKMTMAGEDLDFMEMKVRTLQGEIRTIETRPIAIQFNGTAAIQVVFHDVTTQKQLLKEQLRAQLAEESNIKLQEEIQERQRTEKELQEAQKYTRLLIDSSLDMICASDRAGNITEFNLAAQRTFGYRPEEVINQHVSMLYADPSERIRITEDELFIKGSFAGEVINKKKSGELFIAYLSASVLKNDRGEVIGAMGVSRDISLLKQAEDELRTSEERLKAQSSKLNAVIESSSHVIWTIDRKFRITSFNHNFAEHMRVRYNVEARIGLNMVKGETVSSEDYNRMWVEKYERVFKGHSDYFETKLIDINGNLVWREIYLNPIMDEHGEVLEISGIAHDITEKKIAEEKIKQSLQEKEVLLKEVHHRVKNNLQVISSILNLQSSYVKDPGTLNILKESQNRIKSMAFIHESLYQTKDFTSINFSEYVINLSQNLIHSYSNVGNEVKLNLDIQNVFLNLDLAIPCGLIINEIVSNALKYAFVDHKGNEEVSIRMILEGEYLELQIGDNGRGLPKEIDFRNTESLGLQLVVTLTDQLNGTIDLNTEHGTRYTIKFKQNQVKNRI